MDRDLAEPADSLLSFLSPPEGPLCRCAENLDNEAASQVQRPAVGFGEPGRGGGANKGRQRIEQVGEDDRDQCWQQARSQRAKDIELERDGGKW